MGWVLQVMGAHPLYRELASLIKAVTLKKDFRLEVYYYGSWGYAPNHGKLASLIKALNEQSSEILVLHRSKSVNKAHLIMSTVL
jgi:hypothetical protein